MRAQGFYGRKLLKIRVHKCITFSKHKFDSFIGASNVNVSVLAVRALSQAFSRQPVTAKSSFRSPTPSCSFCCEQSRIRTRFCLSRSYFPLSMFPQMHHPPSSAAVACFLPGRCKDLSAPLYISFIYR